MLFFSAVAIFDSVNALGHMEGL